MSQNEKITVNGTSVVHEGNKFGSNCGAGFNRRGGVPEVRVLKNQTTEVTCKRCLKSSYHK